MPNFSAFGCASLPAAPCASLLASRSLRLLFAADDWDRHVLDLGGVLELVVAAQLQSRRGFPSDSRTEHMHRRLHEDLAGLGLMNENGAVACTLRKLRLKLALRMGQPCLATERMLVASKSWGKISLREKKKWIEIPVTADPAWTRKEPPHA